MSNNSFHRATLASAGTGKTYSLVENYLYALFGLDDSGQKKRPHQILALTFTEKAAQEMRIRIARRLQGFLSGIKSDDPLNKIAEQRGVGLPGPEEIRGLLRALPNASIATFHAFASSLLKQEAAMLKISPQFSIMQPSEERILAQNILRSMVLLHIKQEEGQVKQPLRSLIARFRLGGGVYEQGLIESTLNFYFKLFEKGVTPADDFFRDGIERCTFDDIYCQLEHVRARFVSFFAAPKTPLAEQRIVEVRQALEAFSGVVSSLDEKIIAGHFLALRGSVKGNFGDRVLRSELVAEIVRLGALLCDYFVADDEAALCQLIKAFHQEMISMKALTMQLSFSDLLLKIRDALRDNLVFRELIKTRFLHVMVDEYQDTSPLQEEIIALIAESRQKTETVQPGMDVLETIDFRHGASLFVVGDKKQSIYGFRGADLSLFDRMLKKMAHTHNDTDLFTKSVLKTNYRSEAQVIELVNRVSRSSLEHQGYSDDDDLSVHHEKTLGASALWVSADDGKKSPFEANLLCAANGIAQLLHERREVRPKSITVLVRRIKSARIIKDELFSAGIAARIVGGEGFFQQQEIIDVLSFLKLLVDPAHEHALLTVMRSPLLLLSDQEIVELLDRDTQLSIMLLEDEEAIAHLSAPSRARLRLFLETIAMLEQQIAEQGLLFALDHVLTTLDFAFTIGLSDQSEQKFANINKLRTLVMSAKENYSKQIDILYQKISDDFSEPLAPDTAFHDAITIMTIHQSKGLEFDIVVVSDTESVLPHDSNDFLFDKRCGLTIKPKHRPIAVCAPDAAERTHASTRIQKIQEDNRTREKREMARLLYVALTRAKKEIYVSASEASVNNPKSDTLLGMFLKANTAIERRTIAWHQKTSRSLPELKEERAGIMFKPALETRRIFSSALNTTHEEEFLSIIDTKITSSFYDIDGNLAHDLMAYVGAQVAKMKGLDQSTLRHLLDSGGRARGLYDDQEKYERSLSACLVTLEKLIPDLCRAKKVIFEAPLFSQPNRYVLIEGFSDAVLIFEDWIGVIEFKSSYRLITAANTYLQVFAYAHALKQFGLPVKYAVCLIGAKNPIKWRDFNEDCENLLTKSLF